MAFVWLGALVWLGKLGSKEARRKKWGLWWGSVKLGFNFVSKIDSFREMPNRP
ncbi:hypothetical protein Scep_019906 [Stephania cephalantha]|uniref:Uncharacterized protein n=1 Tax=Stephania cephalantha TaxID=152367 RepID=A0AAP0NLV5_9MAGN